MGSDISHPKPDSSDREYYRPPRKEEKDPDRFKGSPPPEKTQPIPIKDASDHI